MAVASGHPPRCLCRCQWADAARRAPRGATGWHGATDIIYSSARLGEKTLTTALAAPWNVRPEAWNRGPWSVWTGQAGRSCWLLGDANGPRGLADAIPSLQPYSCPPLPAPPSPWAMAAFHPLQGVPPDAPRAEKMKILSNCCCTDRTTPPQRREQKEARRRSEGVKRYASCPCFLEWDSRQAHRRATSHCCPEARASAAHATFLTLCGESLS